MSTKGRSGDLSWIKCGHADALGRTLAIGRGEGQKV